MIYNELHVTPREGMARAMRNLQGPGMGTFIREYEGACDCYGRPTPTSVADVEMHTHKRLPYEVELNAHSVGIDATAQVMRVTNLK